MGILDFLYNDLAIDLGTANTVIISKGKILVDEPSIIAIDRTTNKVIALGRLALQMHEKTHENIKTIKPLKDGVIANYQAAEMMIRGMIKMANQSKWKVVKPLFNRMVICIPSGITDVEKRAVRDSAEHTGAKEVYMIYEPIAAALGININILEPKGSMIVDIGGGTTEIAVIALAGIICDQSIRIGGDAMNMDVLEYMRKKYNLLIGERTAERIKIEVGAAVKDIDNIPNPIEVSGRDLISGIPKVITVGYEEIIPAIEKSIAKIEEAVLKVLEESPPELAADINERGIYLTGGGALLRGLDKRLSQRTNLKVHIANDPLKAVVNGTGIALKDIDMYKSVLIN